MKESDEREEIELAVNSMSEKNSNAALSADQKHGIKNGNQADEAKGDQAEEKEEELLPFEEYTNKYIRNYKPIMVTDQSKAVSLTLYSALPRFITTVSEAFPEFQDKIATIGIPLMEIEADIQGFENTSMFLPCMESREENLRLLTNPDNKKACQDFLDNFSNMLDEMSEKYNDDKSVNRKRLINVLKNHVELLKNPDFINYLSEYPDYYRDMTRTFVDMPGPLFYDNENKEYKVDNARYEKFLNDHLFLDQIEEHQNFFLNEYLPYAKKNRDRTLTGEDAVKYNEAYIRHLQTKKEQFEKITEYDHSDPDIAANKVCNQHEQFEMDWKGVRFGQSVLKEADENLSSMMRGWPAADIPFLRQMALISRHLTEISKHKSKDFTAKEIKTAKTILNQFKKPYENILKQEIVTPEDRLKLILAIEEPLKKYAELDKNIRQRGSGKNEKQGEASITYMLEEAKARKVFREEVGCNKAYEKSAMNALRPTVTNILSLTQANVSESFKQEIRELDEYNDLSYVDGSEDDDYLWDRAFYSKADYKLPKVVKPNLTELVQDVVLDPAEQKNVLKTFKKFGEKTKEIIYRDISDDEIGNKMKAYFDALIFDEIKRTGRGYSNVALEYRTIFGGALIPMENIVDAFVGNDCLRNNMIKYQTKFPVYDLVIEHNKLKNTLADYYEEKDKTGDKLSTEREEFYRQKIYDQTVTISAIYSKACATAEDPEFNKISKSQAITTEEAFHMHPIAARGTRAMNASLDAYKMGLENGWGLDDIAVIAAYKNALDNLTIRTKFNVSTTLDGLVMKDKTGKGIPVFDSEAEKDYYSRMISCYQEMSATPIKSAKDRKHFLDQMTSLIQEGKEKNFCGIVDSKYYMQCKNQLYKRNLAIEVGKQPAVNSAVKCGEDRIIESYLDAINSQRTDLWFSSENSEHKNLRIATENLQKFVHDNPDKGVNKDKIMDYSARYLAKLDEVTYYSKIYQDKRAGASTEGGKKRLLGAMNVENYANMEKDNIIKRLNAVAGTRFESIDEFRKSALVNKGNDALMKLIDMKIMPTTQEEKKNVINLAADVIIGRIAGSDNAAGLRTIKTIGANQFKKQLMQSSEFKSMIKSYVRDRSMTPDKFVSELSGDGAIQRLQSYMTKTKHAEDIAEAKQIERDKADVAKSKARIRAGVKRERNAAEKKRIEREREKARERAEEEKLKKQEELKKQQDGKKKVEVPKSPSK